MGMRATGIVRRIDDLGRVVVPKELRRTMRIKEGDPLEIYLGKNSEIILKKYQPFVSIDEYAQMIADSLFDTFTNPVFITDENEIVAVAGDKKKDFMKKKIEEAFPLFKEKTDEMMETSETSIQYGNDERKVNGYIYLPVMNNDSFLGSMIMFGTGNQINDAMKQSMKVQRQFIERTLSGAGVI